MSSGSSPRAQAKRWSRNETAAKLFREGMSYRKIAEQMGISVNSAESAVKAALGEDPKLFRRKS